MSVDVTTWVYRHSQSKMGARLVLLAMADEAASTGELSAYRRSQSWIATKCNMSVRGVRDAIDTLVALGELQVLSEGIGRTKSDYQIVMRAEAASAPDVRELPLREEAASAPSPRSLPLEPKERDSSLCDETFERFWKAYPRRAGTSKKRAASAFKSAMKKGHLEEVKRGFMRDVAMWKLEHRALEHIPHAATWLTQERYMPEEDATLDLSKGADLDAEEGVFYPDGRVWPKWSKGYRGDDEMPSWTDRRGNVVYEDPTR